MSLARQVVGLPGLFRCKLTTFFKILLQAGGDYLLSPLRKDKVFLINKGPVVVFFFPFEKLFFVMD